MTVEDAPADRFRSPRRPTWIEIDQDALGRNVAAVVSELAGTPLMAVVKAGAYGHGAVGVARVALGRGASWVATATVAEALELRHDGIAAPILVFGYTPPEQVPAAVGGRLAVTVFDEQVLAALDQAGAEQGRPASAHLKIETGMNRLGILPERTAAFVEAARRHQHVELEGCYTHFSDGAAAETTRAQLARFQVALDAAEAAGHRFRLRHAANSAAWRTVPEARLDLVRCGLELLGLQTPDGRCREPVLSFRTQVAQVHEISAGMSVGYGDGFRADRPMLVATLPVGYADGFRRSPQGWGTVLIGGQERALLGTSCMDLSMVDASDDPQVQAGDIATLIGVDGSARISAEVVAQRLGTINYEVTTGLRGRVPREFLSAGVEVDPEYN
ncbi:MAG TPA: alanine racemase [Candidatus Dormibacteraeota bacterium]